MISAQEVVRRVNESGRQFTYETFKKYNRRGIIPKKDSGATKKGKLVWLYPERTVEIIKKIVDERKKSVSLDYIASFLWLDIVFAKMSDEELNIIKDYLGDYTLEEKDERGRVLSALTAGLEFMEELRRIHTPELKLLRLYWDMWRGIRLLVRFHQGKISEAEFKEKFDPKPELDQETKEFAEKMIDLWSKQEEAEKRVA
jgi:hypothetical protein